MNSCRADLESGRPFEKKIIENIEKMKKEKNK
jgi:hypothetical protein